MRSRVSLVARLTLRSSQGRVPPCFERCEGHGVEAGCVEALLEGGVRADGAGADEGFASVVGGAGVPVGAVRGVE